MEDLQVLSWTLATFGETGSGSSRSARGSNAVIRHVGRQANFEPWGGVSIGGVSDRGCVSERAVR